MNIISYFMDYAGVNKREGKQDPKTTIVDFRYEAACGVIEKLVDLVGFEQVLKIAIERHEMNLIWDMQDIFNDAQKQCKKSCSQ